MVNLFFFIVKCSKVHVENHVKRAKSRADQQQMLRGSDYVISKLFTLFVALIFDQRNNDKKRRIKFFLWITTATLNSDYQFKWSKVNTTSQE